MPRPCVLDPERVIEYPWHEELPKDQFATPEHNLAHEPTGLQISRYSHGGFFICSAAPDHPASFFTQ